MIDLGQGFTPRFGKVTEQMPELKAAGEKPISMDHALEQQYAHPETWGKTYVFTGDASHTGTDGDVVIELDSLLLLSMDKNSVLSDHALVLSQDQWEERIGNLENLHLSPDKVVQAEGKGYVKRNGVWQPENRAVAEVWYALGRGRNLQDHAELASQKSNGAEQVMNVYFDTGKRQKPTMRAWCVLNLNNGSSPSGDLSLSDDDGRLVGVAPEALVGRSADRKMSIDTQVYTALRQQQPFDYGGRVWAPLATGVKVYR